jgi:prepilin-type N-terminal cleavage/methylation domain-containing protein
MKHRAFTMIELLVVVAIIGILSVTVMAALGTARGRGNDGGVKGDLSTVQVQGTLYYGIGNTYGSSTSSCTPSGGSVFNDTSTTIEDGVGTALAAAVKHANGGDVQCRSNGSAFLVAAKLTNNNYWCIDSVGTATEKTSAPGSSQTNCSY